MQCVVEYAVRCGKEMKKTLWTYWEGASSPTVDLCRRSWKRLLGQSWTIRVLSRSSIGDLDIIKPRRFDDLSETMKSDVIRLSVLLAYGGVWMDASVYLLKSLDWLEEYGEYPYFGYYHNEDHLESWFIHAKAGDPCIRTWLETLNRIIDRNEASYFAVYDAFKQARRESPEFESTYQSIPLHKACFDTKVVFYDKVKPLRRHVGRMVKFTHGDRVHFDSILERNRRQTRQLYLVCLVVCGVVACIVVCLRRRSKTCVERMYDTA